MAKAKKNRDNTGHRNIFDFYYYWTIIIFENFPYFYR